MLGFVENEKEAEPVTFAMQHWIVRNFFASGPVAVSSVSHTTLRHLKQLQRFVEGYVWQRRRYLGRRVSAQREGHGGFSCTSAEMGSGGGAGGGRGGAKKTQGVTDASRAEFRVRTIQQTD